jgi:intergrase/recombinase
VIYWVLVELAASCLCVSLACFVAHSLTHSPSTTSHPTPTHIQEDRLRAIEDARVTEENAVQRAEELARLAKQTKEDRKYVKYRNEAIAELVAKVADNDAWRYFISCVPLPTVTNEADLNTFLTMLKDKSYNALPPDTAMIEIVDACETTEQGE